MLSYLDALIDALSGSDATEAARLIAHPLARLLPEDARDEALAFVAGDRHPLAAPLHMMRLRHQTAELLREASAVADLTDVTEPVRPVATPPSTSRGSRAVRFQQMELPLSA